MSTFQQELDRRTKNLDPSRWSYKLTSSIAPYGIDALFGDEMEVDEKSCSLVVPYADGNRRDGVGDRLRVEGIVTERHAKNPVLALDHFKHCQIPVGLCEHPETHEYCNYIDPQAQRAKVRTWFYQGKGLANVDRSKEHEHAVLCAQLFDLCAKRYLRSGSIGYSVRRAEYLPADYQQGVPQGQDLISVLMLEASLVTMPANMDTSVKEYREVAREIICKNGICGYALAEPLIKSLKPYADAETRLVTGYQSKSINETQLQDAGEWLKSNGLMPGYGQIFVLPGTGKVWYVGGDGDEDGFGNLVKEKLSVIPGVSEVAYEAEGFPPKTEGWKKVYSKGEKSMESTTKDADGGCHKCECGGTCSHCKEEKAINIKSTDSSGHEHDSSSGQFTSGGSGSKVVTASNIQAGHIIEIPSKLGHWKVTRQTENNGTVHLEMIGVSKGVNDGEVRSSQVESGRKYNSKSLVPSAQQLLTMDTSAQNAPPAKWKPGLGALKAMRAKYRRKSVDASGHEHDSNTGQFSSGGDSVNQPTSQKPRKPKKASKPIRTSEQVGRGHGEAIYRHAIRQGHSEETARAYADRARQAAHSAHASYHGTPSNAEGAAAREVVKIGREVDPHYNEPRTPEGDLIRPAKRKRTKSAKALRFEHRKKGNTSGYEAGTIGLLASESETEAYGSWQQEFEREQREKRRKQEADKRQKEGQKPHQKALRLRLRHRTKSIKQLHDLPADEQSELERLYGHLTKGLDQQRKAYGEKVGEYKGKKYRLLYIGNTKYGYRAKLGFFDGTKEFWVDGNLVRESSSNSSNSSSRYGGGSHAGEVRCRHCGKWTAEGDDWCMVCGRADYEKSLPAKTKSANLYHEQFLSAFDRLQSHNQASLADLRPALGWNRGDFDRVLNELRRANVMTVSAAEGRGGISQAERAAMVEGNILFVHRRKSMDKSIKSIRVAYRNRLQRAIPEVELRFDLAGLDIAKQNAFMADMSGAGFGRPHQGAWNDGEPSHLLKPIKLATFAYGIHPAGGAAVSSDDIPESLMEAASIAGQHGARFLGSKSLTKSQPSDDISPEKAKQVLKDGTVHNKPLSDAQRGMFGAAVGKNKKSIKSADASGHGHDSGTGQFTSGSSSEKKPKHSFTPPQAEVQRRHKDPKVEKKPVPDMVGMHNYKPTDGKSLRIKYRKKALETFHAGDSVQVTQGPSLGEFGTVEHVMTNRVRIRLWTGGDPIEVPPHRLRRTSDVGQSTMPSTSPPYGNVERTDDLASNDGKSLRLKYRKSIASP